MRAVARRRDGYAHDVEIEGGHSLLVDEPESAGGTDRGPSPTRLLGAALASCIAITMEMYADRKEWDLLEVEVAVDMEYEKAVPAKFDVTLRLPKSLTEDQVERLKTMAARCPVHKALAHERDVTIVDRVELI
jgi:putative redox protein